MSGQRTEMPGRKAAIERLRQALREERNFNEMISDTGKDMPGWERPDHDETEDNFINLLLTLGPQFVHDRLRRVFRNAMFSCVCAPTAQEIKHLSYLDELCTYLESMAVVAAKTMEEAEALMRKQKKGKRMPRGVKVSPAREVEEDLVQALFDWGFPTTLDALRTAERRVTYYGEVDPTSEVLADLVILRAVIDKIEAFGWAAKMMGRAAPKTPTEATC